MTVNYIKPCENCGFYNNIGDLVCKRCGADQTPNHAIETPNRIIHLLGVLENLDFDYEPGQDEVILDLSNHGTYLYDKVRQFKNGFPVYFNTASPDKCKGFVSKTLLELERIKVILKAYNWHEVKFNVMPFDMDDWVKINQHHVDDLISYLSFFQGSNDRTEDYQVPEYINKEKPGLTMGEIALICIHQGRVITRRNANDIALEFGQNSGDALYNKYIIYRKKPNRIAYESTEVKQRNKIDLFHSVANYFKGNTKIHEDILAEIKASQAAYFG